jgi:hypothetical protein
MKNFRSITSCFLLCFLLQSVFYAVHRSRTSAGGKKPMIVFVTGDHEYSGETTLPLMAAELEKNYGFRTQVLKAYPDQNAEENIRD